MSNSNFPGKPQQQTTANNKTSIDDCLNLLGAGFLRGGIGGFLKGGTTATANLPKEIRIGVTLVSELLHCHFDILFKALFGALAVGSVS